MENTKKMMATAQIKRTGGSFFIYIPPTIMEMMDFKEGDIVKVPFLEFEKIGSQEEKKEVEDEEYELIGEEKVEVRLKNHDDMKITQSNVLNILNNPTLDMESYRTAYVIWNKKRYGIKKVCAKLFGFNDFNTVEGEKYLNELGFKTGRVKN